MMRTPRILALCLTVLFLAGIVPAGGEPGPTADTPIRIVEPTTAEILYGRTKVVASVTTPESIAYVVFRLDVYPKPICIVPSPPFECEFDAGKDFQGHRIRVQAVGKDGRSIGDAVLETLDFSIATEVELSTLVVPVVASSRSGAYADLAAIDLRCTHGGEPCEVSGVHRLEDEEKEPVSLEILVDVSKSMDNDRAELQDALRFVLAHAPGDTEISLTEFAGTYTTLAPFTSDAEHLDSAVSRLSYSLPYTCLLGAIRKSLYRLHARRGHRVLFVVSDGMETCEIEDDRDAGYRVIAGAIAHTVSVARRVGVPIYFYHFSGSGGGYPLGGGGSSVHEGLAAETGGRRFAMGDLQGLGAALRQVVEDLKNLYLVDVTLPESGNDRIAKRFRLEPRGSADVTLRYPEYLAAGSRLSALLAMIEDRDPEIRLWGASHLANRRDRRVLSALLRAMRKESDYDATLAELTAIYMNAAHLLVHGTEREQSAALDAVGTLIDRSPVLVARLLPALRLYLRIEPVAKLRGRAERYLSAASAIPPEADPRSVIGPNRS